MAGIPAVVPAIIPGDIPVKTIIAAIASSHLGSAWDIHLITLGLPTIMTPRSIIIRPIQATLTPTIPIRTQFTRRAMITTTRLRV